ncbi:hypothetical protein [Denitratisoma sp. DHT3]|uniref:hypothetical protein n=1 Tax=Denitratisoma sp. DHT3 TaxID=1981880 RepID=UPI00119E4B73|nr:hypothetical protein [Denitratisoma sp. DHT3]
MKAKTLFATSAFLTLVACSSTPSKSELDAEVRRLCAIDGGIKVYETVRLPAERFDKYGNVRIPSKATAKPTDEYFYDSEDIYLVSGDPHMIKMITKMIRRSDGKRMGDAIRYGRGGGDIPGPWYPSSFTCPEISKDAPSLESSIFIKGEEK